MVWLGVRRRQATPWTIDDPVNRRIYASLSDNELTNVWCQSSMRDPNHQSYLPLVQSSAVICNHAHPQWQVFRTLFADIDLVEIVHHDDKIPSDFFPRSWHLFEKSTDHSASTHRGAAILGLGDSNLTIGGGWLQSPAPDDAHCSGSMPKHVKLSIMRNWWNNEKIETKTTKIFHVHLKCVSTFFSNVYIPR